MTVCLYHDTGGGRDMRDVIREYVLYLPDCSAEHTSCNLFDKVLQQLPQLQHAILLPLYIISNKISFFIPPPHHLLCSSLSHCSPCLPFSTIFSSHSFLPPFLSSLRSLFLCFCLTHFPLALHLSLFLFLSLYPVDMSGITRVGQEGSSSFMFSLPHTMISSGENLLCPMMRYTTMLCDAM